jgi:hypothetical protein
MRFTESRSRAKDKPLDGNTDAASPARQLHRKGRTLQMKIAHFLMPLMLLPSWGQAYAVDAPAKAESAKAKPSAGANRFEGGSDVLMPQFKALDTNKDGFLSKTEIKAYPRAAPGEFERADKNHDGKLSYDEFKVLFADTSEDRRLGSK